MFELTSTFGALARGTVFYFQPIKHLHQAPFIKSLWSYLYKGHREWFFDSERIVYLFDARKARRCLAELHQP